MPNLQSYRLAVVVTTTALGCAGCAFHNAGTPPLAQAQLESTQHYQPATAQRGYAYIAAPFSATVVYVYALPLTPSSQPLWLIGGLDAPGSVGFDPGQTFILVAGSPSGQGILVYESRKYGPVSFVLPTPLLPEMLEVDKSGDVFQGQSYVSGSDASYQINVYMHPITKKSVPAFTMNTAVNQAGSTLTRGIAFDRHGNLWVKDDDNQTMDKFVPPFSAKSVPKLKFPKGSAAPYGSMIFDKHNVMFVTNSEIDVYKPPFTRQTVKAFTISAPAAPNSLAVDSSDNLYAACNDGYVYVFSPPFSASSAPQVTMPIPGSPNLPFISIKQ